MHANATGTEIGIRPNAPSDLLKMFPVVDESVSAAVLRFKNPPANQTLHLIDPDLAMRILAAIRRSI